MKDWGFTTRILHADRWRQAAHGAMHEPVHTSVAFGHEDAHDLAAIFQGRATGYVYGRQNNPTVTALQEKISIIEDGLSTLAFATGMGAIGSMIFALCRKGDHVVSSQFLFGNTTSLFDSFAGYGLEFSFVDATDAGCVEAALQPNTRLVFVETIANPRTQIADLAAIGELCRRRGVLYVVDNTMTSAWVFRPRVVGAGLAVNSLTKYLGGHGNALGGAITELGNFDWQGFPNILERHRKDDPSLWGMTQIRKRGVRDFGASLSAQAAHDIAVGAETLALRMARACGNAQALASMLAAHPKVERVYYPGLASHPEHERARKLFRQFGALLGFELRPDLDVFALLNRLRMVVKSTNLGDSRTLAIPVAHTIYHEMGPTRRAEMGIADGLVRISVGIEEEADLLEDFKQALDA